MRPFQKRLAVLVLFVLLALVGFRQTVFAAPTANLLGSHNPSFEQGLVDWTLINSHLDTLAYKVVDASPGPKCGTKSLRLKGAIQSIATANSAFVPMTPSTKYRFVIWMRIKGQGATVSLAAFEHETSNPSVTKGETLVGGITTTKGQWKRIRGTFTSLPNAGEGRLVVVFHNGDSKLFIDCAVIKPI